jgi:cytochrome c553
LAAALAGALVAAAGGGGARAQDLARGEALYDLCQQCHGVDGRGDRAALAPAIAGLPTWYVKGQLEKFRNGQRGLHFDDVAGMRMRPMSLYLQSDPDLAAVAAYVEALTPTKPAPALEGGDPQRGQPLYVACASCHGVDGSGNPALFGPPLRHTSDWYLVTQLQNFKTGVRGARPGDTNGALMRPFSMTLADEQAMRDVVAYIMTLGK